MTKRVLALVLALCMVLGMIPAASAASGTYGENIRWSFDESTGVLTLSGAGDMEQTDAGYPWLAYKDAITRIEIDPSLTEIGDEAFYGCTALTSVEIPGTVEEIGSFAFGACTALETVKIADGVAWIGMYAFDECTALKHVTLPNTVEELNNTFDSCTALEQVTVPEGVKVMWDTFAQCYNLKSVELPSTVERIFGTFADCRSLTSVNLPEGLEIIGTNTFFGCISLKNLVIPSTVTVIQGTCFCGGKDANGSYQKGVDPIYFLGDAPEFSYDAFDGDVFSQEITCYYPQGNDTWTEDVMQDYGGDVSWVAYDPATELPDVTDPEPDPNSGVCGENITWTFDPESRKLTIRGSGEMTDFASYEDAPWYRLLRGNIRKVDVGDNITSIGDYAFAYCQKITDVRLPEGLERIGREAFFDCIELENIQIPETVTHIGSHAFYNCNDMHDVKIPDGITEIADYAFAYCPRFTVNIPSGVTRIGAGAFYNCGGDKVVVPAKVGFVGEYAFALCDFDQLLFPGNAPEIQENAFYGADLTCGYPKGNATWTEAVRQSYGATHITWTACDPDDMDIPDYKPDPEPAGQFTDVKESSYYYEPVLWAVENGITTGMSATKFMPENPCTRAQVVTFLWRAAGEPLPTAAKNPFKDVKSSDYYYNAVLWAVEEGITTGMSATSFGPNSPCTRGQVVTFLHRADGAPEPESAKNPFGDVKASDYFYEAVLWAVENGITTGMSATSFGPSRTCTRAQVVTFLYRAVNG